MHVELVATKQYMLS